MGRQLVLTLVSDPVTVDTVVRFVQKVLQVCLSPTCHCLSPTCHCLFTAFSLPFTNLFTALLTAFHRGAAG